MITDVPADTPVTVPVAEPADTTDAPPLLLQVPPAVKSLTGIEAPSHTDEADPMPEGNGLTVITVVITTPSAVYDIVAEPAATPVTTPDVATVATIVFPLLHVPPAVASVSAMVEPIHTLDGPEIAAMDDGLTVMIFEAVAAPQVPDTVYEMVTVPALTPVTDPPETIALPLLASHAPPATASVNVIFDPTVTEDGPVIVPADVAFTVTTIVVLNAPQLPVTVYHMVTVPLLTPVTTPAELTVAMPVLVLLHVPAGIISDKEVVPLTHTVVDPDMGPGPPEPALTVTTVVAYVMPQSLVTA